MRGATALRPQRLLFTHPVRSPLLSSRSICLLCRHGHLVSAQRRGFASSPRPSYPEKTATAAAAAAAASTTSAIAPDATNHYTLFPATFPNGPPPQSPFTIDAATLRREFLQLQSAIHPDKFPQGADKQRAEALSSRINDAYRTLADPLSRAQYLLAEFHGIDVLAEDGASRYAGALDADTLMEIMDVQETVEELSSAPAAEAQATVDRLRGENAGRIEASLRSLSAAFDGGDLQTAQGETVRLRFWYSLRDGLREWEPGHGEIRIVH
ncbi:hypothetical protein UA08_07766 [Talaromyces atroroseus]|uniref:J domain-containing protein n=1 Tax=Talaromyces atroroseus TaxID=1441469 RepID=A0A225A8D1_TALAT|nr:hypothetical protein UA08_07766 [Talaromyces atroroseus]OKL56872.1 hypothetical protein UA08_07766 [Talaromyces atroroseus]